MTAISGGSNAPSPYSDTFKYDLSNNRTEEDITGSQNATVAYTYNGDDQLKTETRTGDGAYAITYGYDNNGSLTSQVKTGTGAETDSYAYDARNRMTLATTNGTSTAYGYDDNGVRVSETTNGVTTYYLNDPQNPTGYTKAIEESATLNGAPTRSYLIGLNVIAQCDGTNGILYLMKDGHGSTRALLNSSATVVEQYNYDAFGTLLASTGAQSNAGSALTVWLFAGDGVYDPATTWTYHLARFTDGFWFTTEDPMLRSSSDPMVSGGYLYGSANPVANVDTDGNFSLGGLLIAAGLMGVLLAGATIPGSAPVIPTLLDVETEAYSSAQYNALNPVYFDTHPYGLSGGTNTYTFESEAFKQKSGTLFVDRAQEIPLYLAARDAATGRKADFVSIAGHGSPGNFAMFADTRYTQSCSISPLDFQRYDSAKAHGLNVAKLAPGIDMLAKMAPYLRPIIRRSPLLVATLVLVLKARR